MIIFLIKTFFNEARTLFSPFVTLLFCLVFHNSCFAQDSTSNIRFETRKDNLVHIKTSKKTFLHKFSFHLAGPGSFRQGWLNDTLKSATGLFVVQGTVFYKLSERVQLTSSMMYGKPFGIIWELNGYEQTQESWGVSSGLLYSVPIFRKAFPQYPVFRSLKAHFSLIGYGLNYYVTKEDRFVWTDRMQLSGASASMNVSFRLLPHFDFNIVGFGRSYSYNFGNKINRNQGFLGLRYYIYDDGGPCLFRNGRKPLPKINFKHILEEIL